MGVFINEAKASNIMIQLVEKDHQIKLRYNNHDFAKCYTDEEGCHWIEIIDADTGIVSKNIIKTLCWRR